MGLFVCLGGDVGTRNQLATRYGLHPGQWWASDTDQVRARCGVAWGGVRGI
jgi:hypothetical protein